MEPNKFVKELFGKKNDVFERCVIKTKHFNPRRLVRLMTAKMTNKKTIQKDSELQTAKTESHNKKYHDRPAQLLRPSPCKNTHNIKPYHLCHEANPGRLSHTGLRQEQGGALKGSSARLSSFEQKVRLQQICRLYHRSHGPKRTIYKSPFGNNRFLRRLYLLWLNIALIPTQIRCRRRRIYQNLS